MDRTLLLISLAAAGGVAVLPPAVLGQQGRVAARRWALVGACALAGFLLAPRPIAAHCDLDALARAARP